MGLVKLTGAGSFFSDGLDQLSVFREFQDARVGAAMTLGDENVSIGCDEHVIRLIEVVRLCSAAWLAERHQQFSVGTEFVYLVTPG